jgi:tetratricopeptide (TPR) repeat protein
MNSATLINEITHYLSLFSLEVEKLNKINLYDINIHAENAVIPILNQIYDVSLVNANLVEKNFPAVDLVDFKRRIAFQVTASADSEKISYTINKFIEKDLYQTFDTLIIYIITNKLEYRKDFSSLTNNKFTFSQDQHIIDHADLLKKISASPDVFRQRKILDILKSQFSKEPHSPLPRELTTYIPRINAAQDVIGREDILVKLHLTLFSNRKVVVVNGIGGIGKTALAQAYLNMYYDNYHHIAWITQTTEDIAQSFLADEGLQRNLAINPEGLTLEQIFTSILHQLKALAHTKPNLLIIDNTTSSLTKFAQLLPGYPTWHILTTSRHVPIDLFSTIELPFLTEEQAITLFTKHCSHIKEEQAIRALVNKLDYHTLTIEILAKTAQVDRLSIESLQKALKLDLESDIEVSHSNKPVDRVKTYLKSIFSLSALHEEELWLMKKLCLLPSESISFELLNVLLKQEAEDHGIKLSRTLEYLYRKGWLLKDSLADTYKMHLIVGEVTRDQLAPTLQESEKLIATIIGKLSIDETKDDNPVSRLQWIPFGNSILDSFSQDTSLMISLLQSHLAAIYNYAGDYLKAKSLYEDSIRTASYHLSDKDPSIAFTESNLAIVCHRLGNYTDADLLFNRSLSNLIDYFTEKHPKTATTQKNYAMLYKELGNYEMAKKLLHRAIDTYTYFLGDTHPFLARAQSDLGVVYRHDQNFDKALYWLKKALTIDETNYQDAHPAIIATRSNLALVYHDLDENDEAKTLFKHALADSIKTFGENHPTTNSIESNYALIYLGYKEHQKAKDLLTNAIRKDEKIFGLSHPSIAIKKQNLGLVFIDTGEYEQAHNSLMEALTIYEHNFEKDHPSIAQTMAQIADVYMNEGNFEDAADWLEKAVAINTRKFGKNHVTVAITEFNLAVCLAKRKYPDFQRAIPLAYAAYLLFFNKLGEGNRQTKTARQFLTQFIYL